MATDDDIAGALPPSPPPAPARRQAAIGAAMRRFDGAAPAGPIPPRRSWFARPQIAVLASIALVAFVGVPAVWMAMERPGDERGGMPAPPARPADPVRASGGPADTAAALPVEKPVGSVAVIPPREKAASAEVAKIAQQTRPPAQPGRTDALADVRNGQDLAMAKPRPAPGSAPAPPGPALPAAQADEITITTARRSESVRDRAEMAEGRGEIVVTGAKRESVRRGDWNACTVDDPMRKLANCRRQSGQIADGLSLAWEGDIDGAIAAFDRVIGRSPRSADAYLNRGLAHRRNGDTDRALADLDKAVRYAPQTARAYYSRSLVLRDRGENRRADADQNRAVLLDPRYATVAK